MRSLKADDHAMLFQLLVGAGLAIIIFFAIMNVGTFINSAIGDNVLEAQPMNSISISYSDHGTTSGSHKINLTGTNVGEIDLTASKLYIYANGNDMRFNLTVNNVMVNRSDMKEGEGWNITFAYLLSNSSVNSTDSVITFDYNGGTGTAPEYTFTVTGTYYTKHDFRKTLVNLSGDYDNVGDSLGIAAVVMAITLPLAAVVAIRKFF